MKIKHLEPFSLGLLSSLPFINYLLYGFIISYIWFILVTLHRSRIRSRTKRVSVFHLYECASYF